MKVDWSDVAQGFQALSVNVTTQVSLRELSRWKIGGTAPVLASPASTSEVSAVIRYCNERGIPYVVIGDTSNLLFCDDGLQAVLIRIGRSMSKIEHSGTNIKVHAGRWVPSLARFSASKGLTGLEHTAGIPGTVGGLVCMNGGSQRKGIGQSLVSVTAVMPDGSVREFSHDDCGFAYRTSVFQVNGAIITEVELQLDSAESQDVRRDMLSILKSRRLKFPLKMPNCGSVFASNPAMYDKVGAPGFAIEQAGLKGFSIGDAKISDVHANFFVNKGFASSSDMLALIHKARDVVHERTGFLMDSEVRYVNPNGTSIPANDARKEKS
jgi:UDP-N-acetylmuramate dehydrogenase|tara:strand:+ start:3046 stop:4017 length:972 start_codon:yes stop_codon:yes gene_type:complete